MTRIKLPGASYQSQSVNADCQRTVNLYPEKIESGDGNTDMALYSSPGLKVRYNLVPPPITVDGAGTNNGNEPILNVIDVKYAKGIGNPGAYYQVPQPPGLDVGDQLFLNLIQTPVVAGPAGSIVFLMGQTRATWCFGIVNTVGTIQAPTVDNGTSLYDQGFTDGLQKWTGAYGSEAIFGGAPQPTTGFSSLIQDTITPGATLPFDPSACVPYDMEIGTATITNPGAYTYARFNGGSGSATGTINGVTFTKAVTSAWNLVMFNVAATSPVNPSLVLAFLQCDGGSDSTVVPAGWSTLYAPTSTNYVAVYKKFVVLP